MSEEIKIPMKLWCAMYCFVKSAIVKKSVWSEIAKNCTPLADIFDSLESVEPEILKYDAENEREK